MIGTLRKLRRGLEQHVIDNPVFAADLQHPDRDERTRESRTTRPARDLSDYAAVRGLESRGDKIQPGFMSAQRPLSSDLNHEVLRGTLPGGAPGILTHRLELMWEGASGLFLSHETTGVGFKNLLTPGVSGRSFMLVPYTTAAVRVAHLPGLRGLRVARKSERDPRHEDLLGTWQDRPLDDLGLPEWAAAFREHSDPAVVEQLLAGPVRELLAGQTALGFELQVEYGQAIVSRQHFLHRHEDLDALCEAACRLARGAAAPASGHGLAGPLPEPDWRPGGKVLHVPILADLGRVAEIAAARGMALEHPMAFHAAHAHLDVPGEAFGVLRGRLPGTDRDGRLVSCAERPMHMPEDSLHFLTNPGGTVGCDLALLEVGPDVPETTAEGELEDGVRIFVRDGVLIARKTRLSWQMKGESLDQLALAAALAADRRAHRQSP